MNRQCCVCGVINDQPDRITVQTKEKYYCGVECLIQRKDKFK